MVLAGDFHRRLDRLRAAGDEIAGVQSLGGDAGDGVAELGPHRIAHRRVGEGVLVELVPDRRVQARVGVAQADRERAATGVVVPIAVLIVDEDALGARDVGAHRVMGEGVAPEIAFQDHVVGHLVLPTGSFRP